MENKPINFTGTGVEFFKIWIVNIGLTILTLGIYSAWAKVRTLQYFYGNTFLDNTSFRYTARPLQILKGRVIAFVALVFYSVVSKINPFYAGVMLIFLMVLIPAFLVMSLSFRAKNSSYRNVRFNFQKNFKQAYKVFAIPTVTVGLFLLILLGSLESEQVNLSLLVVILLVSIILMIPWWDYMIAHFKVVHAKYGSGDFIFTAQAKNYYYMYFKMYALLLLMLLIAGFLFYLDSQTTLPFVQLLFFPLSAIIYFWIFAYLQAKRTNLLYSNLDINGNKVKSELKVGYLLYLYVTNTLAIMLSLGLLIPWAKIRTAKYRASVTSVDVIENLNDFTASELERQSALGEEMGEMFDLDLGF